MLETANLVLVSANDRIWFSDHMEWSWMPGLHGLFWPLMIVLIAAILVVAFRLATRDVRSNEAATGSSARRRPNSARDIHEARYSRGEIDRADYLERKRELS